MHLVATHWEQAVAEVERFQIRARREAAANMQRLAQQRAIYDTQMASLRLEREHMSAIVQQWHSLTRGTLLLAPNEFLVSLFQRFEMFPESSKVLAQVRAQATMSHDEKLKYIVEWARRRAIGLDPNNPSAQLPRPPAPPASLQKPAGLAHVEACIDALRRATSTGLPTILLHLEQRAGDLECRIRSYAEGRQGHPDVFSAAMVDLRSASAGDTRDARMWEVKARLTLWTLFFVALLHAFTVTRASPACYLTYTRALPAYWRHERFFVNLAMLSGYPWTPVGLGRQKT